MSARMANIAQARRRRWRYLMPLALLLTGGCTEMMFKRGAGPGAMATAQQDCRAASDYAACLEARGFTVKEGGEPLLAALAPVPVATAASPATATATTTGAAIAAKPALASAPGLQSSAAAPAVVAAAPADPLQPVKVGSWWKLGGNAGALAAAQAACVKTLGNAHRPAPDSHLVTTGMLECLRAEGWRGLGH